MWKVRQSYNIRACRLRVLDKISPFSTRTVFLGCSCACYLGVATPAAGITLRLTRPVRTPAGLSCNTVARRPNGSCGGHTQAHEHILLPEIYSELLFSLLHFYNNLIVDLPATSVSKAAHPCSTCKKKMVKILSKNKFRHSCGRRTPMAILPTG